MPDILTWVGTWYGVPCTITIKKKTMLKEISEELAQETFGGSGNAIDIDTIRSIADIIFALLEQCRERRSANQVAEAITNPGFVQQAAVRRRVRRELSRREWRSHGRTLANNLINKGSSGTKEDALALVQEVDEK